MYFFPKRHARAVFHGELIMPFGHMTHEQLVVCVEEELAGEDPNYQFGDLFEEAYAIQVLHVFKYIIMISFDIAEDYEISLNNWTTIAAEFLCAKYLDSLGGYMFQRTFSDAFKLALDNWERMLEESEDYEEFESDKIQMVSLKSGTRKQYKTLNCKDCQVFGACNRKKPKDCDFINAVENKIGAKNMIKAPEVINRQDNKFLKKEVNVSMNPNALNNEMLRKELEGVWNYFYANKVASNNQNKK
ncbi:MAG: hypothetical protein FWE50_01335 [Alphaproteobacteria bacterium]|nr:hypothetical protein [Alphaproteobacteria bacterium]